MVITIDETLLSESPNDLESFYEDYPSKKLGASNFLNVPKETLGPHGLLYVGQREMAAVTRKDNVRFIGSEDATTCVILVLQKNSSGAVAVAHIDGTDINQWVCVLLDDFRKLLRQNNDEGITVHMYGAYGTDHSSKANFKDVMDCLHRYSAVLRLGDVCVGTMNSIRKENALWPIIYGIAVDVQLGRIFPASFEDKGPEPILRSARNFVGQSKMFKIYDNTKKLLHFDPFKAIYNIHPETWLQVSDDEFLLHQFSTSPEVEPPDFVENLRETLKLILDNPHPDRSLFQNNKPHCFKMDQYANLWKVINT